MSFSMKPMLALLIAISIGLIDMFVFVKVGFLSLHNLIILFCFILLTREFIADFNNQRDINQIMLMFFVFLIVKNINYINVIINGELIGSEAVVIELVKIFFYIMVFYLSYWLANNHKKHYGVVLLILTFSAIFGFFEHPLTPFTSEFVVFKLDYFAGNLIEDTQLTTESIENEYFLTRPSGPYGYAIKFAGVLVFASILSLYMYNNYNSKVYFYMFLLFLVVACLNMTRSAILGIIILGVSLLVYRREKFLYLTCFFLVLIFSLFVLSKIDIAMFDRVSDFSDNSSNSRLPMFLAGLLALFDHPLGPTVSEYAAAKSYVYIFYPIDHVLEMPSHNGIVNIGIEYGVLGIVVFFMLLFNLILRLKTLEKCTKYFWISAFFCYMFQGMFHNDFVFIGDYYGLILLGLFFSDVKQRNDQLNIQAAS